MASEEIRKAKHLEASRRHRAKKKALGIKDPPKTKERLADQAMRQHRYRERRGGPPNPWAIANPERHAENVRKWRAKNPDKVRNMAREGARKKRSTPWGLLNSMTYPALRRGVRRADGRESPFSAILGYTWLQMREHLQRQFTPEMTWENWGAYWEIDHIKPTSSFRYETMSDPEFRAAWSFENIRPLHWRKNRGKGGANIKHIK